MTKHIPVLLNEVIEQLNIKEGDVVVDATLGGGGYTLELSKQVGENGRLLALDMDERAIERFCTDNEVPSNIEVIHANFSELKKVLQDRGIEKVDAVVADLGISSDQLESEEYGLSFLDETDLDMRLDFSGELTAKEIVNTWSQGELEKIFVGAGEKFARRIAQQIVESRSSCPIESTKDLTEIVQKSVPQKFQHGKRHVATKVFMALRMAVNREEENLNLLLASSLDVVGSGGRVAIVTFHSGEDVIVKKFFRENARGCVCPKEFPVCRCDNVPKVLLLTRKAIEPSDEEISINPRARSARLRVVEKI